MSVMDFLTSIHRFGKTKSIRVIKFASLRGLEHLGELRPSQRSKLIRALAYVRGDDAELVVCNKHKLKSEVVKQTLVRLISPPEDYQKMPTWKAVEEFEPIGIRTLKGILYKCGVEHGRPLCALHLSKRMELAYELFSQTQLLEVKHRKEPSNLE